VAVELDTQDAECSGSLTCGLRRMLTRRLGPEKLSDEQRRDLLEIVEDRYERRSTIVTSQVPVDHWYDMIGNPTLADAILDRLVHNAYRIELTGESLRKQRPLPSDA
ncbi:ATP-binding protein, partial [Rhizobium sp. AQ_MP]|uniref:ATP-binding protein n=1 Tax=Rhizobium sp. AQ_MP TaxID=2761536 RepID=UPI001FEEEDD4